MLRKIPVRSILFLSLIQIGLLLLLLACGALSISFCCRQRYWVRRTGEPAPGWPRNCC